MWNTATWWMPFLLLAQQYNNNDFFCCFFNTEAVWVRNTHFLTWVLQIIIENDAFLWTRILIHYSTQHSLKKSHFLLCNIFTLCSSRQEHLLRLKIVKSIFFRSKQERYILKSWKQNFTKSEFCCSDSKEGKIKLSHDKEFELVRIFFKPQSYVKFITNEKYDSVIWINVSYLSLSFEKLIKTLQINLLIYRTLKFTN